MVHVIAAIEVREGCMAEFLDIFKSNVPEVHKEKGCLEYRPTIDLESGIPVQRQNDAVTTIIEKWETLDDLKAHLVAPHMIAYKEKVKDLVVNVDLRVLADA